VSVGEGRTGEVNLNQFLYGFIAHGGRRMCLQLGRPSVIASLGGLRQRLIAVEHPKQWAVTTEILGLATSLLDEGRPVPAFSGALSFNTLDLNTVSLVKWFRRSGPDPSTSTVLINWDLHRSFRRALFPP
jgi:hypothetical protein